MVRAQEPESCCVTPFIILSLPRSGTQMLSSLLRSHPDVIAHGEVFNGNDIRSHDDLVWRCWRQPDHVRASAVGATLMMQDFAPFPFLMNHLLALRDMRVIVLERGNQLERIRSVLQAGDTWNWDVDMPPAGDRDAVTLPVRYTLRLLQGAATWHRQLGAITNPLLWLYYEDLVADPDWFMACVWKFLGVNDFHAHTSTYRQESRPLCETVANFEEISEALRDTEFHYMTKGQP